MLYIPIISPGTNIRIQMLVFFFINIQFIRTILLKLLNIYVFKNKLNIFLNHLYVS